MTKTGNITILNEGVFFDSIILISIIKRLVTPFHKTKAFKLGIIDENGKFLKRRKEFTREEKDACTHYDVLIFNLKKIIGKIPFGKTRLGSFAAAMFLIREEKYTKYYAQDENILETCFKNFLDSLELENKQSVLESYLKLCEEPTNTSGGGQIFGTDADDGVVAKKKPKILKRNKDDCEDDKQTKKCNKKIKTFSEYRKSA